MIFYKMHWSGSGDLGLFCKNHNYVSLSELGLGDYFPEQIETNNFD